MHYFVDVILPIPLKHQFTYSITKAEASVLKKGMRLVVPFGKTKLQTAIVLFTHNNAPINYQAKPIQYILDKQPIVTNKQIELWQWIASYYMCSLGEVMRAALPSALLLESETILVINKDKAISTLNLTDEAYIIYEALEQQNQLKLHNVVGLLSKKNIWPAVKRLIDEKAVVLKEELYQKYTPKLVRQVQLANKYQSQKALKKLLETLNRAPKQKDAVLALFSLQTKGVLEITTKALLEKAKVSSVIIKTLIDKGVLKETFVKIDRINLSKTTQKVPLQITFNTAQKAAFKEINSVFKQKKVCLLHGVTASGKTQIYIKLIKQVFKTNQQALYLIPEIALTTQLVNRLKQYFKEKVLVYHSRYSLNERVEVWQTILKANEPMLIVGARSSILLPFKNLGLIVVDEEHEQSYKQFNPAPRYHARDTAVVLANKFKAKIILGSATPSIESYNNAINNKYGLVNLTQRYANIVQPKITIVDLKDKYKRKLMKGHFSDDLLAKINQVLTSGNQVILFQNRRGFSPIVECTACGFSPQCPNCDVSLTYHQYRNQLRCHYCGYATPVLNKCTACSHTSFTTKGFGTEQIETELKTLFPKYKVARMDLDTTKGKYSYDKIINAFETNKTQILVGTQMLTKGLDFKNVKLVGVLNADNLLNFPDFRAHERSFQLLKQVAGRSGRSGHEGDVIIQSYNPSHSILKQLLNSNFREMYTIQMKYRKTYQYPPFYRLIKLTLKHKNFNKVEDASAWLGNVLRQHFGNLVLGPEYPPVSRIRNMYNKNILIKIPKEKSLTAVKGALAQVQTSFKSITNYSAVRLNIDVDNY